MSLLEKANNWEYKLYLLIKNELYNLDKLHHIEHKEINENLKRIFVESVEFISDNKQKYLIINQDKLSIPNERLIKQFLRGNIEVDESSYELNTKSINKLLKTNFIFPLVEKMLLLSDLSDSKKFNDDSKGINNQLSVANSMIKKLRDKNKNGKHKEFDIDIIVKQFPEIKNTIIREAESSRNKKGKINFSKLGRKFDVCNHTAQNWCKKLSIREQILQLQS